MKIGDQLEVVAKLKGEKDASKRKEEVKGLLVELGIENCYGQYPNQMSGGQKQRAAITRCLYWESQLILADEPTASLDPERGKEIAQLIQREVKSKHKSAIMVTHDRSVLEYVDTVYEMKKGKLVRLSIYAIMFQKEGGAMFSILVAEDDHAIRTLISTS